MEFIDCIHSALDAVFLPLGIYTHRERRREIDGAEQKEYIVIRPTAIDGAAYANDSEIITGEIADVCYYADADAYNSLRIKLIRTCLQNAGMYIPNATFYAPALTENDRICAVTEVEKMQ